jgi:hypothetical protein
MVKIYATDFCNMQFSQWVQWVRASSFGVPDYNHVRVFNNKQLCEWNYHQVLDEISKA